MTTAELERSKVEKLAAEYRSKGYAVTIEPSGAVLPEFLRSYRPDLVATAPHDNVVVEVRSTLELESDDFVRLAEAVEAHPEWRLQLEVVELPAAQEIPARGELAGPQQVQQFIEQARSLSHEHHYEAATMLAWSAVESLLRRQARATGADAERKGSLYILKHLYASAVLDAEQYETLLHAMQFRNALAHGFAAEVDPETVQRLIREAEHLQSLTAA